MKSNKQFTSFTLGSVRSPRVGADTLSALKPNLNICLHTQRCVDSASLSIKKGTYKKTYICKNNYYLTQGPKSSAQRIVTHNTKISNGW